MEPDSTAALHSYARRAGLCVDSTSNQAGMSDLLHWCRKTVQSHDRSSDVSFLADAIVSDTRSVPPRLEKPSVEIPAIKLLHSLQQCNLPDMLIDSPTKDSSVYKLELPLLSSENDYDVHKFKKMSRTMTTFIRLPIWPGGDDELAPSTQECRQMLLDTNQTLRLEKLQLSSQVVGFLRDITTQPEQAAQPLDLSMPVEQSRRVSRRTCTYDKLTLTNKQPCIPIHLSPPLLPLQTTPSSSSTLHLQPLSQVTSPTGAELQALKDDIYQQDKLEPLSPSNQLANHPGFGGGDNASSLNPQSSDHTRPPAAAFRPQRLKMEAPLTHASTKPPPTNQPSLNLPSPIKPWPAPRSPPCSSPSPDRLLREFIEPAALTALEHVHNEQLVAHDDQLRVDVPHLSFPQHVAPWNRQVPAARKVEDRDGLMDALGAFRLRYWPGAAQLERRLTWRPFDGGVARGVADEALLGSGDGLEVAEWAGPEVGSVELDVEPRKLLILRGRRGDEEELPVWEHGEETPMSSTRAKRSLVSGVDESRHSVRSPPTRYPTRPREPSTTSRPDEPQESNYFGDFFSASTSLERFLAAKGHAPKKPRLDTNAPTPLAPAAKPPSAAPPVRAAMPSPSPLDAFTIDNSSLTPPTPCSLILNSSLFRQHDLIAALTQTISQLDMIERAALPVDIAVSPSTGILLTSMQRIKQKPLPGQHAHSPIQQRILAATASFERVVILVALADAAVAPLADARDCDAVAELAAFAAICGGECQVLLVPESSIEQSRWVLSVVAQQSPLPAGLKLFQEQTTWEVFLGQAGLNPFAAQHVLFELKTPAHILESDFSSQQRVEYGLPGFVGLSSAERLQRFSRVLGGTRVLQQMNDLVSASWAHLF